jgi:hypothetical protein
LAGRGRSLGLLRGRNRVSARQPKADVQWKRGDKCLKSDPLLALAIKHLSDGNARIERQKKIIERLAAHGPAALKAQTSGYELLSAMYVSLKHMSADKADIERLHRIKTWLSEISAWPAPD